MRLPRAPFAPRSGRAVCRVAGALALLVAVLLGGPGAASASLPQRYVVTASWLAEIFVALGAAGEVVGTGGGVDHLPELAGRPRLPGFRQTSAEPILALAPTVVVSTTDVLDPVVAAQLRRSGVRVELFEPEPSIGAVEARVRAVARLTGRRAAGEAVVRRFRADLADAETLVRKARSTPRGLFILSGGRRPTLVAGRGTGPATLIAMAGGINVADGFEGFRTMSQEAMVAAAPEFILVNQDGLELKDGLPVALSAPGAALTPAWRNRRIITLPGAHLQGFGLLTPTAIRALAFQLHPELRPEMERRQGRARAG